ncbi:MAG: gluconate 5-dehydrogenase [Betaproteobacteria bacterium RIFCSPLOWO2_12_FULL_62_58]|nr:MAG: gluconate 5-dehydrogenase [Betaproteobacteria bacterium RIFCSPLOWO2_12_FULL_62_58]
MATIRELFDLTGRVSVITGGSAGLGLQMARGLAEAGSHIVICARNAERCEQAAEGLRAIGVEVLAAGCDVSQLNEVEHLKDEVMARFGRVDVLINNAGRAWFAAPEEMPLDRWQYVIDLNVTGTFLCSQIFGREMIRRKRGKIINIASVSGLRGKDPSVHNSIAYNTTKGAVVNMTRDLAVKWAHHNILVNAIAPGFFLASRNRGRYEERKEHILGEIPLARPGGEDDLKGAAVYLASDASNFVTGTILSVDGGTTAW